MVAAKLAWPVTERLVAVRLVYEPLVAEIVSTYKLSKGISAEPILLVPEMVTGTIELLALIPMTPDPA